MDLAAITAAYDAIGLLSAETQSAFAAITDLGAIPPFPDVATSDSDYSDAVAAQATWRSDLATAQATLTSCIQTQTAAEQSLLDSGDFPQGQWVEVTGLLNWGGNSTQYISWPLIQRQPTGGLPLFLINALPTFAEPLNPYPSLT